MIQSKEDLKEYLYWDKCALGRKSQTRPRLGRDEIWRYEILLRKAEYYTNCRKGAVSKILYAYYKLRFHRMSVKLGFSIPVNVFDKGLSIAHYGSLVVNANARIGINCRIQENVTIGATGGSTEAPTIGDCVFLASGARIIGNIEIADGIAVGANAVVTHSFLEPNITIAGVPAKKISSNSSEAFMVKYED